MNDDDSNEIVPFIPQYLFRFKVLKKLYTNNMMLFADCNDVEVLEIHDHYWKARNVQTGYIARISPQENTEFSLYKAKVRYDTIIDHIPGIDTLEEIILHDQSVILLKSLDVQAHIASNSCVSCVWLLLIMVIMCGFVIWYIIAHQGSSLSP